MAVSGREEGWGLPWIDDHDVAVEDFDLTMKNGKWQSRIKPERLPWRELTERTNLVHVASHGLAGIRLTNAVDGACVRSV